MMKTRLLTVSALLFLVACKENNTPTQISAPVDPSKIITDGAHGGNKDFFFLPPMVPLPLGNPDFELGKFNNTLKPSLRIDICELKPELLNGATVLPTPTTQCVSGTPLKTFAPGSVNVVNLPLKQNGWWTLFGLPADGFYYVLWDTRQSNLKLSSYYRIKVFIDGVAEPLGVADVDPMSSLRQWKYTLTGEVIQLVDDVLLPITFRVEKGGGSALCGDASLCFSSTVSNSSPSGSQTVTVDAGGGAIAGATFPNGWLPANGPQNVVVTVAQVDIGTTDPVTGESTKPCHLGLKLQQFPGCFNFSTTPHLAAIDESGRQFAIPVTVAVCYSLEAGNDLRKNFAEMYASGPNEPPHPLADASDAGILSAATRSCTPTEVIGAAPSNGISQFATASWRRIKSGVNSLFGVKTAYGVDLGLGGIATAFSNVGPAISATIQPVGSTEITRTGPGTVQVFVRLIGSNHHDGQHQNSVGLPDLPVHFQLAEGNNGAISQLGTEVGSATQLDMVTDTLPLDLESPVAGGGYAAVNWAVPGPGVYHLTVDGAAVGGPLTFDVTVTPAAIDLGALEGDSFSDAFAVNSSGQIVGFSQPNAGPSRAVLWNDGVIVALNLPTDVGGQSRATGINDAGVITGEMTINGQLHAFRWANGVTTDLGLPSWTNSSRGSAINTAGTIVGWSNAAPGDPGHAWSWSVGGAITDLGVLPGDITAAFAINDAGQIVGSSGAGFTQNPWLRQPNGVVTFLGSLGGFRSSAQAINSSGIVVGGSDLPSGTLHPFRWSNGVMTDLGTLGGTFGDAFGIADDGRIVGTANIATGENHAFLWQNGQMRDLGTLGGGRSSALAIKGNIVVGNAVTTSGALHAARWNVSP